jgi:hypothetical protein
LRCQPAGTAFPGLPGPLPARWFPTAPREPHSGRKQNKE